MSTATLAGHRVTHARVHLPAWGIPWAEVSVDEEATLSGRASLVVADLTLSGTIMSGGAGPKGRSSFRLAGGAGSWGRTIPARSYANDAGVKVATVLADAANACGEALDLATVPAKVLGPAWARDEAPAGRVLEHIAPAGWHVAEDGTTKIGKRPAAKLTASVDIATIDRSRRVLTLAADAIASIVPGVVVEGIEAVDVLHEIAVGGNLRSTIWGAGIAETSRRLAAWRRIMEQLDPGRRFRGVFEYRVVTQDGERINLQPIRVSTGMPDLQRVPVRPGVSGARADVALGSRVLVGFVDSDPARPCVLAFEDAEGDGFIPIKLEIDATAIEIGGVAGLPSARVTDPILAGPWSGTIVSGSAKVKVG